MVASNGGSHKSDVIQISVQDLSPPLACAAGNGRVRSPKESPRAIPFPSEATGEEKTGRANASEPLMRPRYSDFPERDAGPGCKGTSRGETAGGDRRVTGGREDTAVPGV